MKDLKKSIAYSRGIWFCLLHPTFLNAFEYQLTKEDMKLNECIHTWLGKGLTSCLSSDQLITYNSWISQMRKGKIVYFKDNIPNSVNDMYAELYDADIWIPPNLIDLDNEFHQTFADCYLNNDYFKNDPFGIDIEGIVNRDTTPYEEELIGYLYLLRVD